MSHRLEKGSSGTEEMTASQRRFYAEAKYAESIFQSSLGNFEPSIRALELSLEIDSEYAPAILAMASVEYQREFKERGLQLILSLVSLPPSSVEGGKDELVEMIDQAGDYLIQCGHYADGLELYRAAVRQYPGRGELHQGVGCCAGHEGYHEEAVSASKAALELDSNNQEYVNDLGWSLFEAGNLGEAQEYLRRAVDMNPSDDLARENLRYCCEARSGEQEAGI